MQDRDAMKTEWKLCYVDGNVLYFTDNFAHQCGDDWDDAPYEHNAGTPYEWWDGWTEEENRKHGHNHMRKFAFVDGCWIEQPCDRCVNSPYSVDDINKGAVPWLYCDEAGGLMAGATIEEAKAWFKKAKVWWGELCQ